jgi:hypothetical protein
MSGNVFRLSFCKVQKLLIINPLAVASVFEVTPFMGPVVVATQTDPAKPYSPSILSVFFFSSAFIFFFAMSSL